MIYGKTYETSEMFVVALIGVSIFGLCIALHKGNRKLAIFWYKAKRRSNFGGVVVADATPGGAVLIGVVLPD